MFSAQLTTLARYMAGEFDNRDQAIAQPIWYVHLRLWQRPVPLFIEDSLTLFAEQANALYPDQPYRPRIMRLMERREPHPLLQVQYYMPKDPPAVQGWGSMPERLQTLTPDQIELLPGCTLSVTYSKNQSHGDRFEANLPPNCRCCFTYREQTYQVSLGFEASEEAFLSYDKGIDPANGTAIWGAMLGAFRFLKRQDFAGELPI